MSREAFEKAYHKETGLCASWAPSNKGYTDVIAGMCYRIWQAAQAQAGGGEAVGKVYYTGSGFLDVDWFTSDIPDDALLYAAPPAAVNQQLLEAIKVCASFLSDFGLENSDAYQQALFAIAAAQEVGNEIPRTQKD